MLSFAESCRRYWPNLVVTAFTPLISALTAESVVPYLCPLVFFGMGFVGVVWPCRIGKASLSFALLTFAVYLLVGSALAFAWIGIFGWKERDRGLSLFHAFPMHVSAWRSSHLPDLAIPWHSRAG